MNDSSGVSSQLSERFVDLLRMLRNLTRCSEIGRKLCAVS
jgi:hypothetical protein